MTLTRRDVETIAQLARLGITAEELPVYAGSLSRILEFVEQLGSADTGDIEAMAHPLADQVQRLRPDEAAETDQRETYQRNAPAIESGLYVVPKVME